MQVQLLINLIKQKKNSCFFDTSFKIPKNIYVGTTALCTEIPSEVKKKIQAITIKKKEKNEMCLLSRLDAKRSSVRMKNVHLYVK